MENNQQTYTSPQQQCKVTGGQVAHQLILNGKGNKNHVPLRERERKKWNRIHADVTIPDGGPAVRHQRLK